jgi:threonine dehydrogenase-like Zn-dependent dehydrogenase
MVLRAEGFDPLIAGHHREKLARLAELGLKAELEVDLEPGFGVVIDCTGAGDGVNRALGLVRSRGRLILKSTAASAATINLAPVVVNEVSVIGSRCGPFGPAIAALETGKVDPRPLISAVYPLEEGQRAMTAALTPPNFKVLLKIS